MRLMACPLRLNEILSCHQTRMARHGFRFTGKGRRQIWLGLRGWSALGWLIMPRLCAPQIGIWPQGLTGALSMAILGSIRTCFADPGQCDPTVILPAMGGPTGMEGRPPVRALNACWRYRSGNFWIFEQRGGRLAARHSDTKPDHAQRAASAIGTSVNLVVSRPCNHCARANLCGGGGGKSSPIRGSGHNERRILVPLRSRQRCLQGLSGHAPRRAPGWADRVDDARLQDRESRAVHCDSVVAIGPAPHLRLRSAEQSRRKKSACTGRLQALANTVTNLRPIGRQQRRVALARGAVTRRAAAD